MFTRLKGSIIWRLIFWFFILSLIPVGVIFVLMQNQARENALITQKEIIRDHARLFSASAEINPGEETKIASDLMKSSNGDAYFLIASDGKYIAHSDPAKIGRSASEDLSSAILSQLLANQSTSLIDQANGRVIGSYRPAFNKPLAVSIGKINKQTFNLNNLPFNIILQIAIALVLSVIGAGVTAYSIVNQLAKIADYADEISKGHINIKLHTRGMRGEIADIAENLQNLVFIVESSFSSMEGRIDDRSLEFERRSNLLKAVADVGKAITSFRNLSELLEQAAHLIHENFGYYHVGVFLLDEHKEYAILSATNSEGGQRMLDRKHQLEVGETSIVGYVTQNAKARIALDVGGDAVFFGNPDLPLTRSEMALPLVVSGKILGALDVQSVESQAFTEEDVSTLQILAEQLAVAIQNANLLDETEKALEAARTVYGDMSREAWSKILRSQPRVGFLATPTGAVQTHSETLEENLSKAFETGDVVVGKDNVTISVPIKIRGESIGSIRLKKSEIAEAWTQDETNLAVSLSDQLSGALESARLYNESQQRAARESLVSDISARISAVAHTDSILRETTLEIGQTLHNASVTFQLLDVFSEKKSAKGQEK